VGSIAAQLFVEAGALLVSVQDHTGAIYRGSGINVSLLQEYIRSQGGVAGFPGAESINSHLFWEVDCDILIPAALEGQITEENAPLIKARMVIEGANGPTTPSADDILAERKILVIPDVIANAGGVTVSYFEWVQDFSSFFWSEKEINARLISIMKEAFDSIWETAQKHQVTLRTATFIIGCTRILRAREDRGLYP